MSAAQAAPPYVLDEQLSAQLSGVPNPGVSVDAHGDIYVASITEKKGFISVFGPSGKFITKFNDPAGPQSLAVDSEGNLYAFETFSGGELQVVRYVPTVYKPATEEIEYTEKPILVANNSTKSFVVLQAASSVAVDPTNDELYVDYSQGVALFDSAKNGNAPLETQAIKGLARSTSIAIDANHGKIYVSDRIPITNKSMIRVFELKAPHAELKEDENRGADTPKKEFLTFEGFLALDVDEATGYVFVGDIEAAEVVYEFEEDGTYLATIPEKFDRVAYGEIAVENGASVPKSKAGYLFVPSMPSRVFAFKPDETGPPQVQAVSTSGVTETDVILHALVNPKGFKTTYSFEYISQQQYEEDGNSFTNATVAGEGELAASGEAISIGASAFELQPGTSYRFRVVAENEKGQDGEEGAFTTFPAKEKPPVCENDPLRIGLSLLLPDCRAYELVTPSSTNGRPPSGVGFTGVYFPSFEASPDGKSVSFLIEGGVIPGNEGSGAFNGDNYLAIRNDSGWASSIAGPSGAESPTPLPGSFSPDQTYSFWRDKDPDTGEKSFYIRYPDGHSELVGLGSLDVDPAASPRLITQAASHIVFGSSVPLEPNSPPAGTEAVYDRSAGGPTHVVSLLPGDETPKASENALYLGASEEGEGIAFSIDGTIYLRLHNEETRKVAGPGATFAGVADEGERVFYLEGGDLFAYDAEAEEAIAFSSSGDVTPVNVAIGGTRAYFVSPTVLTGEPNPNGEVAEGGKENLYLSEEGQISFVGIVTERDVEGEKRIDGLVGGLGLWIEAINQRGPAKDPSRTTPSGSTLLFESRADLAGFESEGFAQVYRYDQAQNRLDCLSCSPTDTPPSGDASLQSVAESQPSLVPFSATARIPNQSPDGKRAFFQTSEPLVLGDTDGALDVYEWEEEGVGSCEKPGGCVYLISGGHSASPDYLYAMSSSGDDVFFRTSDLLLPRDAESTLSIYDARVGGGFPEKPPCHGEECCESESCHPLGSPPQLPTPTTSTVGSDGDLPRSTKCPKGKHRAMRHGKEICVKKRHKRHRHRTGSGRKGGAK